MKTSVYLERSDIARLEWLGEVENRPQAEVVRDAIRQYRPAADREFALFRAVPQDRRIEGDLTQDDLDALLDGFGDDASR